MTRTDESLHAMQSEIDALPDWSVLHESGRFLVALASADEVPRIVNEIGRLREIAFRAAGEGTGRELDLDRFDALVPHLFVGTARSSARRAYRWRHRIFSAARASPPDLHALALRLRSSVPGAARSRARGAARSCGPGTAFVASSLALARHRASSRAARVDGVCSERSAFGRYTPSRVLHRSTRSRTIARRDACPRHAARLRLAPAARGDVRELGDGPLDDAIRALEPDCKACPSCCSAISSLRRFRGLPRGPHFGDALDA